MRRAVGSRRRSTAHATPKTMLRQIEAYFEQAELALVRT